MEGKHVRIRLRRRLAHFVCNAIAGVLPSRSRSWGQAIRFETAAIDDDGEALAFAIRSFRGLLPRALAFHLVRPFAALAGADPFSTGGMRAMRFQDGVVRPQAIGIACALGAVILGIAHLAIAGAPDRYIAINAGALAIGLLVMAALGRLGSPGRLGASIMTMAMALMLLATALAGEQVDGAARWVKLGPLFVQPSLILLPVMLLVFARSRDVLSGAAMIVAGAALALQPDRAMAAMLACALLFLAIRRPDRFVVTAFAASLAGFLSTLVRPDLLPAAPFVDQVFYTSFQAHALAGIAVLAGSVLLLVPAVAGWRFDPANRDSYAAFASIWLAAILAAAIGNYPTPLVGFGGSAILGYLLSLQMLPAPSGRFHSVEEASAEGGRDRKGDPSLSVGLA